MLQFNARAVVQRVNDKAVEKVLQKKALFGKKSDATASKKVKQSKPAL